MKRNTKESKKRYVLLRKEIRQIIQEHQDEFDKLAE